MPRTPSKVIVIGAGVAGLSTAVHAARNGYEVEVFEHHSAPGGVCTAWDRNGYRIEGCIHWLIGATPAHPFWRLYEEIGATEGNRFLPVEQFSCLVDEPTGTRLNITRDLDDLLAQVESISPADKPIFQEIVDAAREHNLLSGIPLDPPELTGVWKRLTKAWEAREDLWYALTHRGSMTELEASMRHPVLRSFLGWIFPDIPVVLAASVLGELSRGTLGTVEGGSHRFSEAIANKVEALGGAIRYEQDVEEILVESDRAIGVRTTDGSEHRADRIVSCAPGYTTIFRMLGGKYADDRVRRRYANWPRYEPIVLASFGAKTTWTDLPTSNQVHLERPFSIGHREVTVLKVRNYAFDPKLAPPGCSVIQCLLNTNFDLWHDLHYAPHRYARQKAELAETLLDRLEPHCPGIADALDMTDVATPYTFWRFARSYRGAFEGFMLTAETMREHVPKTLPGLERFHMAGQWVEPGGGVPPAVYSGRQVVQLICAEDGRDFLTDA